MLDQGNQFQTFMSLFSWVLLLQNDIKKHFQETFYSGYA